MATEKKRGYVKNVRITIEQNIYLSIVENSYLCTEIKSVFMHESYFNGRG